jgi:FixJ family two-component response regulator
MPARAVVSLVDDDISVRESLQAFLAELGFAVRTFASAEAFLDSDCVAETECLVLDVAMPAMSGIDLQRELQCRGYAVPTVFITAQQDEAVRATVLANGAVGCLSKPISEAAMLEALDAVFGKTSR